MDYFSLIVYVALIMAVAIGGLGASALLGKRVKGVIKEEPVECGVGSLGETRTEFNVRFFVIAMLFVLFDIEAVLLAPYVIDYKALGVSGLAEVGVFMIVLGFGLLYAWRKGVLDWSVPLGVSPEEEMKRKAALREEEIGVAHSDHGHDHAHEPAAAGAAHGS
ncbi:MAG: NADH-quinone oxidoreductase subunit A [Planctomycetes bacterium]|nr:NADH-quinone oxidoreductase subunit A [Planctomycetota bacterium]